MTAQHRLTTNISPNEIVFPGSSIVVESTVPLDPRSAQSGIVLDGIHGLIKLSRSGRVATLALDRPIPCGQHTLEVGGLCTAKGRSINDQIVIPFFVTDSLAKTSSSVQITSMTRLLVGEFGAQRVPSYQGHDGRFVELMKGFNKKSKSSVALAFDQSGHPIDAKPMFERIARSRWRIFGKLHPTLHARVQMLGSRKNVPVAIWLRCKEASILGEKRRSGETKRATRQSKSQHAATRRVISAFVSRTENRYREYRHDQIMPVVYASLTRAQIEELVKDREVVGVFLDEREGIMDLANSIAIANSDNAHALGIDGTGIKVAVWEDGPDVTTNLSISAAYKASGFATSDHSRHTHGIVKNVEPGAPHGHAPGCTLISANDMELAAVAWAHAHGCTVISQSFHRRSEASGGEMSFDDIYKDQLVLIPPYPTIVQAAGNYWLGDDDMISPPADEYVNHKGYNSLAVGNHNDAASAMSGDSVFRNPTSTHGDRELPEIAANGMGVTTVGLTKSGTSMAAPAVAGCAALIQCANRTLKSWPEGCRAILLAAARRNISDGTWWQDVTASVDASDGSGAVDSLASVRIAKRRRSIGAAGTSLGWDVGTLRTADFRDNGLSVLSYFVTLPGDPFGPNRVKVALAWNSHISWEDASPIQSKLSVDLDLEIRDGRGLLIGYSGSWDNSYEIAEFVGRQGETYTIKVRRFSGTDDVWYGIAWMTTGGMLGADERR